MSDITSFLLWGLLLAALFGGISFFGKSLKIVQYALLAGLGVVLLYALWHLHKGLILFVLAASAVLSARLLVGSRRI